MTPGQNAAAKKLEDALKACASAKLGVYIFDGDIMVCPTGLKDQRWFDRPAEVCDELGKSFFIPGLVCDGGEG